ncbi:hypothetical protein SCG7086_AN_00130 [Chlamydiales bacterium SCGC AG-110-P3]|nr:hypothetical protein SCG7086_AN_00130 [Chlamydiales bacterium SCGC AG-110-P3]
MTEIAGVWGQSGANTTGGDAALSVTYNMTKLIDLVDTLSAQAKNKIDAIQQRGEDISIADMFDMQMNMNHLAQMSEMSTSIVNATNTAVMSMARNIKG